MKPLNTIANELEKYKPVGMTILKPKEKPSKDADEVKPRLRDEIAAAVSFAALVISLPFLPEYALLIAEVLK